MTLRPYTCSVRSATPFLERRTRNEAGGRSGKLVYHPTGTSPTVHLVPGLVPHLRCTSDVRPGVASLLVEALGVVRQVSQKSDPSRLWILTSTRLDGSARL